VVRVTTTTSARRLAYDALRRIESGGAYANIVLGPMLDRSSLSPADRRFATDLVYGTTRMRRACDASVDRFVTVEPDPSTRTLLRLGAYQLASGVAPHAAVAETVGLAPTRTRGFVNAVLRRVASSPAPPWPSLASELSYPDWIVDRLVDELGHADAVGALRRMNEAAIATERGDGYVQDLSSQWVAAAVEAGRGDLVLDACAAPGGKATAVASVGADVVAGDVRSGRARRLAANAARLGAERVLTMVADATRPAFRAAAFDAVLIDAPCSGLGALRRRPDARWRIRPADVDRLAALQERMLRAAAPLVRSGGRLLYSVCTLTAAESIDHPVPDGFDVDPAPPPEGTWHPYGHGWRVLPQDVGTDGMVLCRYRRR
jgi:16S rRNA (cytosine967-C5)-methyltransferase